LFEGYFLCLDSLALNICFCTISELSISSG
jgi:hypothetical protein